MAEPQNWRERVVGALGAVIMVALVIGAVAGAVTYGAVRIAGLDSGNGSPQGSAPARHTPSPDRTPRRASQPSTSPSQPVTTPSPTARPHERAQHRDRNRAEHRRHPPRQHASALTLAASPRRVHEMGRVNLFGRYPGHDGAELQVQRLEGGRWGSFPVSVTVRGGRFRTWVASGRGGVNRFRVLDAGTGQASPAVAVVVG